MSLIHAQKQGIITRAAKPSVTRQRGSTSGTFSVAWQWNAGNTSIVDNGSAGVNPTNSGGVTYSATSPYSGGGKSYAFNGTNGTLSVTSNAIFTLGTGDFYVGCWVYMNNVSKTYSCIGEFENGGGGRLNSMVFLLNGAQPRLFSNGAWRLSSTSNVSLSTWTHLAISRKSGTTTMYFNGTAVDSTTTIPSINSSYLMLGKIGDASDYLDGRIANWVLSKGNSVYSANFSPPTSETTTFNTPNYITNTTYGVYKAGYES